MVWSVCQILGVRRRGLPGHEVGQSLKCFTYDGLGYSLLDAKVPGPCDKTLNPACPYCTEYCSVPYLLLYEQ